MENTLQNVNNNNKREVWEQIIQNPVKTLIVNLISPTYKGVKSAINSHKNNKTSAEDQLITLAEYKWNICT